MPDRYAKLFALLLLVVAGHSVQAQRNFQPGYIVRSGGDTLRGEINARGEQRMAQQCLFRSADGGVPVVYAPTELKAYGLKGAAYYEAAALPVAAGGVPSASPLVFLRVVAAGKATLYAHPDAADRVHYYFQSPATAISELVQTEQTVETGGALRQEQTYPFRDVLSQAFRDCPAVQKMLVQAELKESQLVAIFNRYNTCAPGQVPRAVATRTTKVHFGLVAGLQSAAATLNDAGDVALKSSLRPAVGLGFLINPASFNSKVAIRLEALYQKQLLENQYQRPNNVVASLKSTRNALITLQTMRVPLMLRYTAPKGWLRPYLQAGGEAAVLLDQKQALLVKDDELLSGGHATTTSIIALRKLGFGLTGGLGVLISTGAAGAVQLEARINKLDNTSEAVNTLNGATTISFLLGYNFGN